MKVVTKTEEFIGKKFGLLTVKSFDCSKNGERWFNCICECGVPKLATACKLQTRKRISCGDRFHRNPNDITGKRFGRLLAIERTREKSGISRGFLWKVVCDCGKEKAIHKSGLTTGAVVSCGCLHKENKTTHGLSYTTGYKANQRVKRKSAIGKVTSREIKNKFELLNNLCLYCGEREYKEKDHIIPLARGGNNNLHNIAPSCRECNGQKHDKLIFVNWNPKVLHPSLLALKRWIERHGE